MKLVDMLKELNPFDNEEAKTLAGLLLITVLCVCLLGALIVCVAFWPFVVDMCHDTSAGETKRRYWCRKIGCIVGAILFVAIVSVHAQNPHHAVTIGLFYLMVSAPVALLCFTPRWERGLEGHRGCAGLK